MPRGRAIYLVRHGERIDNIETKWAKKKGMDIFKEDNSPLSSRGHIQGAELAKWFKNIDVEHVYSSPLDRTLDTATRMIGDRKIPIKVDGSFIEVLYLCLKPPGIRPFEDLKRDFPLIDENYDAVINPWRDKFDIEPCCDDGAVRRVEKALHRIMDKCDGDFVIVSHAATIGCILESFCGRFVSFVYPIHLVFDRVFYSRDTSVKLQ